MRIASTAEVGRLDAVRALMDAAFGARFSDDDWAHALGGSHVLVERDGDPVAHASVVERTIEADGHVLRTGYVEAVATRPDLQGTGLGTEVMRAAGGLIVERFDVGALATRELGFYARLGWEAWRGPTAVRTDRGVVRTPNEDGAIMILRTPRTPDLDLDGTIVCEWRTGDVW